MSSGTPIHSSRRTYTFLAADLNDPNGIKASVATVASAQVYDADDFDGEAVAVSGTKWARLPRTITITRASNVGSYTTDDIVITGTWRGTAVTETYTPADADGGDSFRGSQPFDTPPTVSIPAQVNTGGAFEIGVGDICSPPEETFHAVTLRADGQLNVYYPGGLTDSFASKEGNPNAIAPERVLTSASLGTPTTVDLTVALP